MIAIDTSSLQNYLGGIHDKRTQAVAHAVMKGDAVLPPIVVTEALSDPKMNKLAVRFTMSLPMLEIIEGYWARAGQLRASLLSQGFHAGTPDCLVAQICIDHDTPLIAHDHDFVRFVPAGLKLL